MVLAATVVESRFPSEAIGFVCRGSFAANGDKFVAADTYGGFRWDVATQRMIPLTTALTMQGITFTEDDLSGPGVYEIAVAPSNSNRIYKVWSKRLWRSNDKGATFSLTGQTQVTWDANLGDRTRAGKKMVADPDAPDVLWYGAPDAGVYRSIDAGATTPTFTKATGFPDAAGGYAPILLVDKSSALVSGRHGTVYAAHQANGVYRASGGNLAFTLMSGTPTNLVDLKQAPDGTIWAVKTDAAYTNEIYKLPVGGAWTAVSLGLAESWASIAIHPTDSAKLTLCTASGYLAVSSDGGATWAWRDTGTHIRVATDIPVLAWANEDYMSTSWIEHDPVSPYDLWIGEGIGAWTTPAVYTPGIVTWTSHSKGIAQHCSFALLSPPPYINLAASPPIYQPQPFYEIGLDRAVFARPIADLRADQSPRTHGVSRTHSLSHGWAGDWASSDPRAVFVLSGEYDHESAGFTLDGGQSWSEYATRPMPGANGGSIAAATPLSQVWVGNNNTGIYGTVDRGAAWSPCDIDVPFSGDTGWGFLRFTRAKHVAADRVNIDTYYAVNFATATAGVYRTTTGPLGRWSKVYTGRVCPLLGFNDKLYSVPGKAGHLFLTSGQVSGNGGSDQAPLMRSVDGGESWTPISGMLEVWDVGFGKGPFGSTYPSVFVIGYYSGDPFVRIYRSDDNCVSWIEVGRFVANHIDQPILIEGDMTAHGRFVVGCGGSGGSWSNLKSERYLT